MNDLTIYTNIKNGTLELQLVGRITTVNAGMLMEEVKKELPSFTNIILDAKDLLYISSAGLRQFMMIAAVTDSKNGKTSIKNMNEDIRKILEDTGISQVLEIIE